MRCTDRDTKFKNKNNMIDKYLMKTSDELETMRTLGKILANIMNELENLIKPDTNAWTVEQKFIDLCRKNDVIPACKGYPDEHGNLFPYGLCLGINNEAVHCFPAKEKIFKDGDIVKIDTVIGRDGLYVDHAKTFGIGNVSSLRQKLINTTRLALQSAIKVTRAGAYTGDLGNAIQTIAELAGFNVLRKYSGHGIGRHLHEPPNIYCYGEKNTGERLVAGMTLAIEPLISVGDYEVVSRGKYWQTEMKDGSDFAQFEHTILVTKQGVEILTQI